MAFQTKISRARFVLSPFSPEQMERIGQALLTSISARIRRGEDVQDAPARPLNRNYGRAKLRRGLAPIRDWVFTGATMRSLQVKRVSANRGTIGFIDARADQKAHWNNLRQKQFGISPKDRLAVQAAVLAELRGGKNVQFSKAV